MQNDLSSLTVNGGTGGNTFTVANTPTGVAKPTTTLNSGTGADTVTVQATTGPLTVEGQNGLDTVTIGNAGSVQGIMAPVSVSNQKSFTALSVDDSADAVARMATITAAAITGLAPAAINYVENDLSSLTVKGGTGGNTFTVMDTPNGAALPTTTLDSGTGADTVNVLATSGALDIEGQNGADTVNIGNAGNVQGIMGDVSVSNQNGLTALTVDDSKDAAARVARLTAAALTGLSPGNINFTQLDLSSFTINGGTGGNRFTVVNTPKNGMMLTTQLNGGTGADTVTVQATSGPLNIQGQNGADTVTVGNLGNTQGITGVVDVRNTLSFTALTIDDSADAVGRTVTISATSVTGIAPAAITYLQADIRSLTVNGGSGGNAITVASDPNNGMTPTTTVNSGTGSDLVVVQTTAAPLIVDGNNGADSVVVGNAGSVQGIMAGVTVRNALGLTNLLVDDSADPVSRAVLVTSTSVTGIAPATIGYVPAGLASLTVNGGAGGNVFAVTSTPSNGRVVVSTTINSGLGSDVVDVLATSLGSTLTVNTLSGTNVVNVGSVPPPGVGSVINGILGVVAVNGAGGATQLNINDAGKVLGGLYTVTAASVTRNGIAGVLYSSIVSLVVNAGLGGNTINVLSTSAGTTTTINTGSSADVVNVGNTVNTLDNILGPLAVVGHGLNTLNVNDFGDPRNDAYGITATTVTRTLMAGIAYAGIGFLNLNAGPGSSLFTVLSTAPKTVTTINTGAGSDVVAIGGPNGLEDITGPLAVHSAGILALIFNDQGDPRNDPYTLTATQLSRPGFKFNYVAASLTLNAGPGSSVFSILGTAAGTATTINTGGGVDTVNVGGPNGLDNIAGSLAVNGQASVLTLNYNDQADPRNDPYTLTATGVTRPGFSSTYSVVAALTLNAGAGNSVFTISSTAVGTATAVNAGAGNDVLNVGSAANVLDGIQGPLFLNGQSGTNTLTFNDQGTTVPETYTVTSTTVARPGIATISYKNFAPLTLNGGPKGNTYNIQSTTSATPVIVNGGAGNDTFNVGSPSNTLAGIQGAVTLNGQAGSDAVNINDQGTTTAQNYVITATSVLRGGIAAITYGTVESLTLKGGSGGNTFRIQGTAASVATTALAGTGNDSFIVGGPTASLNGIQGPLALDGQAGTDTITLNDQGTTISETYTITSTIVSRGAATITYASVTALSLNGGTGGNTFDVQSTATGVSTTIAAGTMSDTFNVGSTANTLDGIQGALSVKGTAGGGTVNLEDQGSSAGEIYTITSTTVTRSGAAAITYSGIHSLVVNGGMGANTFMAESTAAGEHVTIMGGSGTNTLVGPNSTNTWDITGMNAGRLTSAVLLTAVVFSSVQDLTGGTGADTFIFENGDGITGNIVGGGGSDTLDDSADTAGVIVDLKTGSATGVGGTVSGIEDVIGGSGPGSNILVGNGGDTLVGGSGRDLLIAGATASSLSGGGGDDILIGGTTSYDQNIPALMAIMSEWTRTDESYAVRVSNIMNGGGLNGSFELNTTTVTGNGGGNTLDGGPGQNLFFGNLVLDTTDRTASETFVSV